MFYYNLKDFRTSIRISAYMSANPFVWKCNIHEEISLHYYYAILAYRLANLSVCKCNIHEKTGLHY